MNREDLDRWFEGPLTEDHIAELRYKLAKARGILYSIKFNIPYATEELDKVLKETKGS